MKDWVYGISRLKVVAALIIAPFILFGCDALFGPDDEPEDDGMATLTVDTDGEGTVDPSGSHSFEEGAVVELQVSAEDPWEFYDWAGDDADDVTETGNGYEITMDGDKEITAFFAEEYYEFEMEAQSFMGAEGHAVDHTDNAPYPPGFEVELEAVSEDPEKYAFLHWSTEAGDPQELFDDHEAERTNFTVPNPNGNVTVQPYFTTRSEPAEEGEFHYDHTNFGDTIQGDVGLTEHYWDISELDTGDPLNFYFQARNLPDRFRVYYGEWEDLTLIFDSGWVSVSPEAQEDPAMYPEGVEHHDWHEDVELSDRLPWDDGGLYEAVITKESGRDVLMIEVEGRDDGTLWDYMVDEEQ